MRPISLELENFMIHRSSIIDFDKFSSALILGTRTNDDRYSNATGKSTLFKAMTYVLFNEASVNLDKLVRKHTDKCKVVFTFESSDKIYRITRKRSAKTKTSDLELEIMQNGAWANIEGRTNTELETELAKILKINYKAFVYSVLFAQKDLSIAEVTSDKRKTMLKEPLQLAVYAKLEEIAKAKRKQTYALFEDVKKEILLLGDPANDIKNNLEQISLNKTNISNIEIELQSSKILLQQKRNSLLELEKLTSNDDSTIRNRLTEISNRLTLNKNKLQKLEQDINKSQKDLDAATLEVGTKEKEILSLTSSLEELKKISYKENLEELNNDISKLADDEIKLKNELFVAESEIKKLNGFLLPEAGLPCPHCKQIVTDEHRNTCLKNILQEVEDLKHKSSKLKADISKTKESRDKKLSLVKEISNHSLSITQTEAKIASLQSVVNNKKIVIASIEPMLVSNKSDIDFIKNEQLSLSTDAKNLTDILSAQSKNDKSDKIESLKVEITKIDKDIANKISEISSLQTKNSLLEKENAKRELDIEKLKIANGKKEEFNKRLDIQDLTVKAYNSSGIPTMIIYSVLNDFQIESNNILQELRPEMELQFEIDKPNKDGTPQDTLDIKYKVHGEEFEWEELSGGQQLYVSLALKLGLSKIIQQKIGIDIKFIALDEVDKALDKAGKDALIDVIRKMQTSFKILVITHDDTLKDKFSNIILVENDINNGSTAKVMES